MSDWLDFTKNYKTTERVPGVKWQIILPPYGCDDISRSGSIYAWRPLHQANTIPCTLSKNDFKSAFKTLTQSCAQLVPQFLSAEFYPAFYEADHCFQRLVCDVTLEQRGPTSLRFTSTSSSAKSGQLLHKVDVKSVAIRNETKHPIDLPTGARGVLADLSGSDDLPKPRPATDQEVKNVMMSVHVLPSDVDSSQRTSVTSYMRMCHDVGSLMAKKSNLPHFQHDLAYSTIKRLRCLHQSSSVVGDELQVYASDSGNHNRIHFLITKKTTPVFQCVMEFYKQGDQGTPMILTSLHGFQQDYPIRIKDRVLFKKDVLFPDGFGMDSLGRSGYIKPWKVLYLDEAVQWNLYFTPDVQELLEGMGFIVVSHSYSFSTNFYRSTHCLGPLTCTTAVSSIGKSSMDYVHHMTSTRTGALLYVVNTHLVAADIATGKQTRFPEDRTAMLPDSLKQPSPYAGQELFPQPAADEELSDVVPLTVMPSDCDMLRHANHTSYVKYCHDAASLVATTGRLSQFGKDIARLRIKHLECLYQGQCRAGNVIDVRVWEDQEKAHTLKFLVEKNHKPFFHCKMEFYETSSSRL